MCALFPTEVSCSIPVVGAAGENQEHNGICVLTQNIINEKIYLLLWFWFVFLSLWSVVSLFLTVAILFFEKIRFLLIYKKVKLYLENEKLFCCCSRFVISMTKIFTSVLSTSFLKVSLATGLFSTNSPKTQTLSSTENLSRNSP